MHEPRSTNPYEPLQAGIPRLDEALGTWGLAPVPAYFPYRGSPNIPKRLKDPKTFRCSPDPQMPFK